ncbi:hypothetical protein QM996_23485 (plasmid) [Sinorhizobium chiapasense]|uniref:hypothetical protein n=1 Tax=Sinorhizobium chiapasense TaxID=501572 RepID=UPI002FE364D4
MLESGPPSMQSRRGADAAIGILRQTAASRQLTSPSAVIQQKRTLGMLSGLAVS